MTFTPFLYVLIVFFSSSVKCVYIKEEKSSTRAPPQVEELPWLSFFENKNAEAVHKDFERRSKDNLGRQNSGITSFSTLCPPGETGQFVYPPDCKRFINCWKGRGSIQVCAPGTLFNPETLECDFPGKVKCAGGNGGFGDQLPLPTRERYVRFPHQRPEISQNPRVSRKNENENQPKPDSVPAKPYPDRPSYFGPLYLKPPTRPINALDHVMVEKPQCSVGATGLYPHPTDCTKFLKCWSGNTFIQNCGPGTFFNPLISACDHPRNVPCTHEQPRVLGDGDIVTEDLQIPAESIQIEHNQKPPIHLNEAQNGQENSNFLLDLNQKPFEVTTATSIQNKVDNVESLNDDDKTNRRPKVINLGNNKKVSNSNPIEKEPVPHLIPPQYDVFGKLVSIEKNEPLLAKQPPLQNKHVLPQSQEQPNVLSLSSNNLIQDPYQTSRLGHSYGQFSAPQNVKNYYGYLLSKAHPYYPSFYSEALSNPQHHPHHHRQPLTQNVPSTYLQPPPVQYSHFPLYAPYYTFSPNSKTHITYYIPKDLSMVPGNAICVLHDGIKVYCKPEQIYSPDYSTEAPKSIQPSFGPSCNNNEKYLEKPVSSECTNNNMKITAPKDFLLPPNQNSKSQEPDYNLSYYPNFSNGHTSTNNLHSSNHLQQNKPLDFEHEPGYGSNTRNRFNPLPNSINPPNFNNDLTSSKITRTKNSHQPQSPFTFNFFSSGFPQYPVNPNSPYPAYYPMVTGNTNANPHLPINFNHSQKFKIEYIDPSTQNLPFNTSKKVIVSTEKINYEVTEAKNSTKFSSTVPKIENQEISDVNLETDKEQQQKIYNNPTKTIEEIKKNDNTLISPLHTLNSPGHYYQEHDTFPRLPAYTEKSTTSSVEQDSKYQPDKKYPKENILSKIDLRTKTDSEDPESISNTFFPDYVEKISEAPSVKTTQSFHVDSTKIMYGKDPHDIDSSSQELTKPTDLSSKRVIKSEADIYNDDDYSDSKDRKIVKVIQKPFVRVKQAPPSGQTIRLRNGGSHLDGYLELKNSKSKWGLVCDESGGWNIEEATVACRELGFIRGAELCWQGYPIQSEADNLLVSVNEINCKGNEMSLLECNITQSYKNHSDIGRNAVGLRCYDNLASHCQPGEILYNQHCYKLHGKENPDDPGIKTEEASEMCKKYGGKLVDITSQYENDFISEWLIKKHPEVTSVATGGIGISVLGRPMWLWEGTNDPMVYERWWSGWSGNQNIPKGSINGPLCIILRKTFSCADEGQRTEEVKKDEETCSADYFFWDVEDCAKLRTSVYICERPMDDIGCVVGNGEGYVGIANTTATGLPCLSWDHPKAIEGLARRNSAQERSSRLGNHNYCRNLGNPDRHPWCFVEGKGNSEYCAIPQCWDSVSGPSRSYGSWSSCEENQFECKPGECIDKYWVCDGQKDCADGRDEEKCQIFTREFTEFKEKKMKGKGVEKWPNTNANICAKLCLEKKIFKCKSYSFNARNKDCFLSDTNIGLSGQVVTAKGWTYYELYNDSLKCTLDKGFYGCENGKCINVSNVCDGKSHCEDNSDERDCRRLGYEIRLAGAQDKHIGRLEVKILGKWGVICDDMFDQRDADVACRELGFNLGAAEVLKHSHFPLDDPLFLIDRLDCWGNETSIKDCSFPGWGKHSCGADEIVSIVCKIAGVECPEGQWQCKTSKECILVPYLCDGLDDCDDKSDEDLQMCTSSTQIRLAGGSNGTSGRLEIKHFDIWGTVCHDDFSVTAATAVCKILGFNGPSFVKKNAFFGPGKGPIWLDNGQCFENETDLEECKKYLGKQNNCKHEEDVSIVCSQQKINQKSSALRPVASSSNIENVQSIKEKIREVLISECNGNFNSERQNVLYAQEKVVGGTDVLKEALPWQASVRVKSGAKKSVHWCGAIVITPYHVLTAGHCLRDYKKAAYFIRVGDYDTEVPDPQEREFEIEHLFMHPEFSKNFNLNNDIGLVKVKGEIDFGDHIKPACLAPSLDVYHPGINCSISGWGSVSAKSAGFARTLRRAFVPILEPSVCRAPFVYGESLSEGMFCAGRLDGGIDSCQGDSGGPLMCQFEGREYLYGITSWGHGCGRPNKPGVYTNVAFYSEWIQQKIQSSLK